MAGEEGEGEIRWESGEVPSEVRLVHALEVLLALFLGLELFLLQAPQLGLGLGFELFLMQAPRVRIRKGPSNEG